MTLTPEDKMRHPKPLKKLPRDCLGNIRSKNFGLDLICGQEKEKSEKSFQITSRYPIMLLDPMALMAFFWAANRVE